jgi:Ca2+-binding RTX toxin-like protein
MRPRLWELMLRSLPEPKEGGGLAPFFFRPTKEGVEGMRKPVLLLAVMAAALLMPGCSEPITCPTGPDGECQGTQMADQITGTMGVDQIYALGGDDSVQGGDGLGQRLQSLHLPPVLNVVVEAISAADRFASNVLGLRSEARGDDLIKGGLGADYVKGGSSADKMYGGDGNDKMGGWTGNDIFFGGAGNDRVSGGEGADEIHGEEGDDIDLDGDASIDKIYGEDGNDFELDGDSGNDLISGGSGDDGGAPTSENLQHHGLRGEGGENQVYGNEDADTIDAQTTVDLGGAREEIFGGDGDDTIPAANGVKDVINCGLGLDTVVSYDRGLDVLMICEQPHRVPRHSR